MGEVAEHVDYVRTFVIITVATELMHNSAAACCTHKERGTKIGFEAEADDNLKMQTFGSTTTPSERGGVYVFFGVNRVLCVGVCMCMWACVVVIKVTMTMTMTQSEKSDPANGMNQKITSSTKKRPCTTTLKMNLLSSLVLSCLLLSSFSVSVCLSLSLSPCGVVVVLLWCVVSCVVVCVVWHRVVLMKLAQWHGVHVQTVKDNVQCIKP